MDARRMEALTEAPKAAPVNIRVGSQVLVKDSNSTDSEVGWIDGEVLEILNQVIVQRADRKSPVTVDYFNVCPKDPRAFDGVEDVTELAYLHEPAVLQTLASRYKSGQIYTYCGSILIAINPFKKLPHLYGNEMMGRYKEATHKLSPHVYAVADAAYRAMKEEKRNQSILVSGESGAGKTESTKMLMEYLAYMGGRGVIGGRSVEDQVIKSIPVLEAFGNAKTVTNNNSSRFGKYVELKFDRDGKISGASVRTYLLERSRVCQTSDRERNYHCFYLLFAAPEKDIEKYKLGDPRLFHYLNQSKCYQLDGVDEAREYLKTREAMEVVGITPKEQDAIFQVVAAILHLGNVEFTEGEESGSSKPKEETLFHLNMAAELFMCDVKGLEASLCKRVIASRYESITKLLNPVAAVNCRDGLAKLVYSRLSDWLVKRINESIDKDTKSKTKIGVLDMCGFESFENNSFEQFCINFANEKLQQHFNQHVFTMEEDEYKREEVEWSDIECDNNQDVLDLIEKKPGGIIALLDDACMLPETTYETFAKKLCQNFKMNKWFVKPTISLTDFTIRHYGSNVTYQVDLFLEKNKDYNVAEHLDLLSSSKCIFVKELFLPLSKESTKPSQSSKLSSISTHFKKQLRLLLDTLNSTNPHYIRCLKPNNDKEPVDFENHNILQQLRCGGVMEVIRISYVGYPIRLTFDEFFYRFCIHAPKDLDTSYDKKNSIRNLLEEVGLQGYQIGKTKIFLRNLQTMELDARILGFQTIISNVIKAPTKKLEKQVEELTHFLDLEKSRRVDLEVSKSQVEEQVKETNILLEKEREAKQKDMERENKKYFESQKLSEERLRKVNEVESEIEKLKNTLQEVEERVREPNISLKMEKFTTKKDMEKFDVSKKNVGEDKKKCVESQKLSGEWIRKAKDKFIHQQHLITVVIASHIVRVLLLSLFLI